MAKKTIAVTATTINNSAGANVTSLVTSHAHPSGSNTLVVSVGYGKLLADPYATVTATFGGQSLGSPTIHYQGSTRHGIAIFTLLGATPGTEDVTVTLDLAQRITVSAVSMSNVLAVSASGDAFDDNTANVAKTLTVSLASTAGEMMLGQSNFRVSAAVLSFGSGETGLSDQGINGQDSRGGYSYKAATGTPTALSHSITARSTNHFAMAAVTYEPEDEAGTTYEGAITLAGQGGITAAAGLLFTDAVTMAASGGVTSAVDAVLGASVALGAGGSLTASALATMGGSISVGAGAGVAPGNVASMTVAALLASAAGMTSTGGFIVSGELELGAAAGDTATATLLFAHAIELGSTAAASTAGRLDAAGAFTLTADGGVAADGRQDMAATIELGAAADVAVTADATALFSETITLGAAATVAVEARGLFGATVTFTAEMDMAAASSMTMAVALELAAGAVVDMLATMPGDIPTARRTIALAGCMIGSRALQGSMTITVSLPGETATPRHLIGRIT